METRLMEMHGTPRWAYYTLSGKCPLRSSHLCPWR